MSVFGVQSTGNPVFSNSAFGQQQAANPFSTQAQVGGLSSLGEAVARGTMTVGGAVNASFICLGLCIASAVGSTMLIPKESFFIPMIIGVIAYFLGGLLLVFVPKIAPIFAPIAAVFMGVMVSGISQVYAAKMAGTNLGGATGSGVIYTATGITFAVLFSMLMAYKFQIIRATKTFYTIMGVASVGILLFCLASLGASLFGKALIDWNSPLGLGIAVIIALVAAFMLIVDFDMIEQGAAHGLPKHYEWVGAFGLLTTLVWLYISILRILAIVAGKRE